MHRAKLGSALTSARVCVYVCVCVCEGTDKGVLFCSWDEKAACVRKQ